MILLDKGEYAKVTELITNVTINKLFAQAVIEQKVNGRIFVDNTEIPQTCYIVHPYGMTLLLGDSENEAFNQHFRNYALNSPPVRNSVEWMQAFPNSWDMILPRLFGNQLVASAEDPGQQLHGIVELNTRVNFKFYEEDFIRFRIPVMDKEIKILRTDRAVFREMPGSVVPSLFWEREEDFLKNGVGFSLFYENKLASTAYSACINATQLELGIETVPEFRNKGFAKFVCQALIEYCLENNYEPIWACRLENTGSYRLAQKVGFRPILELPYYRLGI